MNEKRQAPFSFVIKLLGIETQRRIVVSATER